METKAQVTFYNKILLIHVTEVRRKTSWDKTSPQKMDYDIEARMHTLQTKKFLEESSSWEEVECAQSTQEHLHDESSDHVEQLKCTDRRLNGSLQTRTLNQT